MTTPFGSGPSLTEMGRKRGRDAADDGPVAPIAPFVPPNQQTRTDVAAKRVRLDHPPQAGPSGATAPPAAVKGKKSRKDPYRLPAKEVPQDAQQLKVRLPQFHMVARDSLCARFAWSFTFFSCCASSTL